MRFPLPRRRRLPALLALAAALGLAAVTAGAYVVSHRTARPRADAPESRRHRAVAVAPIVTPSPTDPVTPAPTASVLASPGPQTPVPRGSTPAPRAGAPASSGAPLTPIHGSSSGLAGFFGPAFASAPFCLFGHQNVAINAGVLTTTYAAGSSAQSAGAPYGGAQICLPLAGGGATDATLSYDVRFPVGFQFVKGGKLPGLYGGVEPFSGGGHNANGWSMRLMWRTSGAAEVYGYISTTTGYGDSWGRGNFSFAADGRWHHLAERVHLNSPGQANGWVSLSYDGVEYVNQTGLAITTTGTPISGLFFSTFYGGHDKSWAPSADMHIDFANFARS